jgi:hypothetical protein
VGMRDLELDLLDELMMFLEEDIFNTLEKIILFFGK